MYRTVKSFVHRGRALNGNKQQLFNTMWSKYGLDEANGLLVPEEVFGRKSTLNLEIGFGDGVNLFMLAKKYPEQDFIGIEVYEKGIATLFAMLSKEPLNNLRIYCRDAVEVLNRCIPQNSLDNVLILFPDPWPKKRHQKRRLIQQQFIVLLQQKIKLGGWLQIVTDWKNYAEHIAEIFTNDSVFHLENSQTPSTYSLGRVIPTRYEKRGKQRGHQVFEFLLNHIPI